MRAGFGNAGFFFATLALLGCSGGGNDAGRTVPADVQTQDAGSQGDSGSLADLAWAQALADENAQWQPTTEQPFFTTQYGNGNLCVAGPRVTRSPGPHGQLYNWVYTNPIAYDAFMAFETIPEGGVVIKQKLVDYDYENPNASPAPTAIGVMIKREPGYAPESGDWEYGYITLDSEGRVTDAQRGAIANCVDCHANRDNADYLFREYLHRSSGFTDSLFEDDDSEDQAPIIIVE